jgi:rhamnose transport system permease protein
VRRRLALVYVLCGFAAGLAAIVYVAHLGQAKSDAGNGYELIAITAVVLGGTSILGGSGTILGTMLGLAAIVILQNGLRLSGWPSELAGVATGVLLIVTIVLERWSGRKEAATDTSGTSRGRLMMAGAGILVLFVAVFALRRDEGSLGAKAGAPRRVTIGARARSRRPRN